MNINVFISMLKAQGFAYADQKKDLGMIIPYVHYFSRINRQGKHQYVSLVTYDDKFVEAVYEVYQVPKNTRVPKGAIKRKESDDKGYTPIYANLLRSYQTLLDAINTTVIEPTYPDSKSGKAVTKK